MIPVRAETTTWIDADATKIAKVITEDLVTWPEIDGKYIAFIHENHETGMFELKYFDTDTEATFKTGFDADYLAFSGTAIVYSLSRDVFMFDLSTNTSTPTGAKAIRLAYSGGDYIALSTDEQDDLVDLNVDGDTDDYIIQYYVISTDTLVNTGLEGTTPTIEGELIVATDWPNILVYNITADTASYPVSGSYPVIASGYISYFVTTGGKKFLHTYDISSGIETNHSIRGGSADHDGSLIAIQSYEYQLGTEDLDDDSWMSTSYIMYYDRNEAKLYNSWVEGDKPRVDGDNIVYQGSLGYFSLKEETEPPAPCRTPGFIFYDSRMSNPLSPENIVLSFRVDCEAMGLESRRVPNRIIVINGNGETTLNTYGSIDRRTKWGLIYLSPSRFSAGVNLVILEISGITDVVTITR